MAIPTWHNLPDAPTDDQWAAVLHSANALGVAYYLRAGVLTRVTATHRGFGLGYAYTEEVVPWAAT